MIAESMGNTNVYTTLNVYTQTMDESMQAAAGQTGRELKSANQVTNLSLRVRLGSLKSCISTVSLF